MLLPLTTLQLRNRPAETRLVFRTVEWVSLDLERDAPIAKNRLHEHIDRHRNVKPHLVTKLLERNLVSLIDANIDNCL